MTVPRVRFTVRHLMIAVAVVSAGLAVLVSGSETLAGAVLLLTLGMLSVSVLGMVYRREETRAFWVGFALLGWGYMSLVLGHWWFRGTDRTELVTSAVLDRLFLFLPHEVLPVCFPRHGRTARRRLTRLGLRLLLGRGLTGGTGRSLARLCLEGILRLERILGRSR